MDAPIITGDYTMKRALIEYSCNQGQHEAWLIRDKYDLIDYFKMVSERAHSYLKRLMDSGVHPNRWDHMITKSPEGLIMSATLIECTTSGGRPLLEYDKHMSRLQWTMTEMVLMRGEVLVVNDAGGYFPLKDEADVIKEWEFTPEKEVTYHIVPECRYINLENDEALEDRTVEYLRDEKGCDDFSFITMLHQHDKSELTEIFKKFKKSGGEVVHVYTTGTNVKQMYDYVEAALNADIGEFEFEFNAGVTEPIRDFLNNINSEVMVTIIEPVKDAA